MYSKKKKNRLNLELHLEVLQMCVLEEYYTLQNKIHVTISFSAVVSTVASLTS